MNKGGLRNAAQVWTEGESSVGACGKGEHVRPLGVVDGVMGGVEGEERERESHG